MGREPTEADDQRHGLHRRQHLHRAGSSDVRRRRRDRPLGHLRDEQQHADVRERRLRPRHVGSERRGARDRRRRGRRGLLRPIAGHTGDSIEIKKGTFQGGLIGNKNIDASVTGTSVIGPMISVYDGVCAGQSNDIIFPPILFAPSGGGGIISDPPHGDAPRSPKLRRRLTWAERPRTTAEFPPMDPTWT